MTSEENGIVLSKRRLVGCHIRQLIFDISTTEKSTPFRKKVLREYTIKYYVSLRGQFPALYT